MRNYKGRTKKSRVSLLLATLLALVLMGIAIVQSNGLSNNEQLSLIDSDTSSKVSSSHEITAFNQSIVQTVSALQNWSKDLLELEQTGLKWTVRWDLDLEAENMEDMAQQLYIDQYKKALNKVITQNGAHISGAIPQYNGKLTLQRVENESGDQKVIVLLQVDHQIKQQKELKGYIEYVDEVMRGYASDITYSAKITGPMKADAMSRIEQVTNSTSVEEYKDDSMKIVTAYSAKLRNSYWINENKMVNLQYAVYVDENTKDSFLTLAVPLISGEFGEIIPN